MAADSNMGFRHGSVQSSLYNRHMVSFQSGAMDALAGMTSGGMSGTDGMFLPGNPGVINNPGVVLPAGIASGNVLLEPRHRLEEWSFEEQAILRDGLGKYADEPGILKYIKIANMLRDKTVRDVALRCRWMTKKEHGKRRKPEEHYAGKKLKDRKEKVVDSYSKANIHAFHSDNMASYSLMMHHVNHNDRFSCEAPALDGPMRNLMDENAQLFSQIAVNLATYKIQDNISLFYRTRNNITAILNSMGEMPGMSQMTPLPAIDEKLLSSVLSGTSQALIFGAPGGIHLKQEPRF